MFSKECDLRSLCALADANKVLRATEVDNYLK